MPFAGSWYSGMLRRSGSDGTCFLAISILRDCCLSFWYLIGLGCTNDHFRRLWQSFILKSSAPALVRVCRLLGWREAQSRMRSCESEEDIPRHCQYFLQVPGNLLTNSFLHISEFIWSYPCYTHARTPDPTQPGLAGTSQSRCRKAGETDGRT